MRPTNDAIRARRPVALAITLTLLAAFLTLAFAPSVALAQATPNKASKTVRVGWYESPFNTTGELGRRSGYAYEYQRKIASYTDWSYEYVEGSWPELMEMLKAGQIDLMSDVSYTEERSSQMLFCSYPMCTEEYYLYVAAENVTQARASYDFFSGKRVGINKGSLQVGLFEDWAKRHGVQVELVELTGSEQESLNMLLAGKIDAYVVIDAYGDIGDAVPVVKIGSSDAFFVVAKDRPDLLDDLDTAMSRIQDENRFYNQTLYEKFVRATGANRFLTSDELAWLEEHGPIRVGYQDGYLAFCAKDDSGNLTGALKDYLDAAADCLANAHIDFEAVAYPAITDALDALRAGEIDCVFPVNLDSYEAEALGVDVTTPVMEGEVYEVVRSADKQALSQMDNMTVAVVEGDISYDTFLLDHYADWDEVTYPTTQECLRAVFNNKADCFLISNYRYNSIQELCDYYHLTSVDTGKEIGFGFAVEANETELYSIMVRVEGVVPNTIVNAALTRYVAETESISLVDFVRANPAMTIAFVVAFVAMVAVIIAQRRVIVARQAADKSQHQVEDLSQRVFVDALTRVRNKGAFGEYLLDLQERLGTEDPVEFAVGMLDCDDLKLVNDRYGHEKGDEYLKTACRFICHTFQHSPVFRTGGDEFVVILEGEELQHKDELVARFQKGMREVCASTQTLWEQVRISSGFATYDPEVDGSVDDVVRRADEAMYANKRMRKGVRGR